MLSQNCTFSILLDSRLYSNYSKLYIVVLNILSKQLIIINRSLPRSHLGFSKICYIMFNDSKLMKLNIQNMS